jgi:hypothetical protein
MSDPSATDANWLSAAAGFIGIVLATIVSYFMRKPTEQPAPIKEAVVTGVGLELGNRAQMDMLIGVNVRIADALEELVKVMEDRDRARMNVQMDKITELLIQLSEKERTR